MAILRTSDALRRMFEQVLQPHGVTGQQYNVLRILRGAANTGEGPLPTMTVAERMIEQEPGITRLVGRLEAKGLLHRISGVEDARQKLCELTPAGKSLIDALDADVVEANRRALRLLDERQTAELIALLGAVHRATTGAEGAPA